MLRQSTVKQSPLRWVFYCMSIDTFYISVVTLSTNKFTLRRKMLNLTISDIDNYVNQKLKDTDKGCHQTVGIEFVCTKHSGGWCIVMNDKHSNVSIKMRSARELTRNFATIDSAYKAISHLTNSILVIGK